jgi:hypothetical protein
MDCMGVVVVWWGGGDFGHIRATGGLICLSNRCVCPAFVAKPTCGHTSTTAYGISRHGHLPNQLHTCVTEQFALLLCRCRAAAAVGALSILEAACPPTAQPSIRYGMFG